MTTTAVDTSVIVAGLLSWHEAHGRALAALRDAANRGKLVVPGHALVETYAVLTRLPSPHRLAPGVAHELLSGGFEERADVVTLSAGELWKWMASAAAQNVGGGAAYDAVLLACAKKAKADRFLTLDAGDFSRLDAGSVEIVIP